MALTADVKSELAATEAANSQLRVAELAAMVITTSGFDARSRQLQIEVDHEAVAKRAQQTLQQVMGVNATISTLHASGIRRTSHFVVRVTSPIDTLARQLKLVQPNGNPVLGVSSEYTSTTTIEAAIAFLRGAFMAHGSLTDPGRSASLEITAPNFYVANAIAGLIRNKLGLAAKEREVRGIYRVVVREGEAIGRILEVLGAEGQLDKWNQLRDRREARATANRLANFDDANLRRSAQAAVAAGARVARALEILGDDIPAHLAYAGKLRLEHKQASLDELGHLASPPMTKDAVAGRIRRLLAMADKKAADLGIPPTDAFLPDDLDG